MSLLVELRRVTARESARFRRVPDWLRAYLVALGTLAVIVALSALILHFVGLRAAPFCSLLLLILLGRAAWLGYGPGLLVAILTLFVVQSILIPGKPHPVSPISF